MKKLSPSLGTERAFRNNFFQTALFFFIAVALIAVPTSTNAQNRHKPTAKVMKRLNNERSEAATQSTANTGITIQPTTGAAILTSSGIGPAWTALGPTPIPNGQTVGTEVPVSGRVTAVAIDPADSETVYVGTAQGGLYQSRDGGATWSALMDAAGTLAIGSLELDPSDSNTLLVGTGESNFSGDSYAGLGVYKVTGLKTSPVLSGPFASSSSANRGIPGLAIDPNNHNTVYIGTATAQQGIGPQPFTPGTQPLRGLYRSTNFFSGSPTFTKLAVGKLPANADFRVTSIVYEPGSSDRMFVGIADASGNTNPAFFGGIYYTTNASAANPTFTRIFETFAGHTGTNFTFSDFAPIKFAINKIGKIVTVVAATGETAADGNQGKAYKAVYNSTGSLAPVFKALPAADGFAGGQGSYNLGVAIDPTNASNIYLVGTVSSNGDDDGGHPIVDDGSLSGSGPATSGGIDHGPNGTFIYSRDGGTTFTPSVQTLHVDSHMVGVAPSNPSVVYTGNDGGVWKSDDAGLSWIDHNNTTFSATQFQSVAVHPTDPKFSIGGTQDNGTEFLKPDGTWTRADFGDGGYALIDQTATDTENVTMYHTYFNETGILIGFGRVLKTSCATEAQWSFKGIYGGTVDPTVHCDGTTDTFNGISFSDPVNFYAPMALGPQVTPGAGQTVYFGTNKLYRSANRGDTMTVVSQTLPNIISAIGISKTNDGVRIVGLNNGKVFATINGSNTMTDVTFPSTSTQANMPAKYIARAVIDPNNPNTAYVVFNGNAIAGRHVWKTTNLNNLPGTVTWTAIDGSGIPDISVNAFVVDPADSTHLYAGTDRGVYNSTDGGATWNLYGTGLPDVAVFDLAISSDGHVRAATHGRGFYEIVRAP
jgi:photosystem II stability/assembly factor-like uncharacterized protein